MSTSSRVYIVPTHRWYIERTVWLIAGLVLLAFTALAALVDPRWVLGVIATGLSSVTVAFTGFWAGLISAYGKWVLSLAMSCVLAFVFAMGEYFASISEATDHLVLAVCGAMTYTTYSVIMAWLFDDRSRRLLLAEAMRAFADYLRAKAALYNPDAEGPAGFRAQPWQLTASA